MFLVKLSWPNIITYLSLVFGVLAMYFAIDKNIVFEISNFKFSLIFLVLAGICDMFDGKVARMCKRTDEDKKLGIQLDSLADTVNFLCAPVVIMISLGMNSIFDVIIYIIFIICGVSRLAYFNITTPKKGPVKFYNGLPVTSTAIIYPVLGLLYGFIDIQMLGYIYIVATIFIAFFFVYRIRVQKFEKTAYIVVPVLALVLIWMLLLIR